MADKKIKLLTFEWDNIEVLASLRNIFGVLFIQELELLSFVNEWGISGAPLVDSSLDLFDSCRTFSLRFSSSLMYRLFIFDRLKLRILKLS